MHMKPENSQIKRPQSCKVRTKLTKKQNLTSVVQTESDIVTTRAGSFTVDSQINTKPLLAN